MISPTILFRIIMKLFLSLSKIFVLSLLLFSISFAQTDEEKSRATEVWDPIPPIIRAGENNSAPSDAVILLGENDLSEWQHDDGSPIKWKFCEGVLTVEKKTGQIKTKKKFGSCQLHIEWRTPLFTEEQAKINNNDKILLQEQFKGYVIGEGQGRGNSGVFLQERYEVQVLDSYDNLTYSNGQAGSIYKQHIPLVNVCKPPGEWQTYDIIFNAPKFNEDGTLEIPGYVTVLQNGVLIQNHVEIKGPTAWIGKPNYEKHNPKESITIQDHGNPVSYRNIWIREL